MTTPDHADPRAARNALFGRVLDVPRVIVALSALAATLATGPWERTSARLTVGVLIAVPILRVAWLVRRWLTRQDRRFALVGIALLLIAALGAAVALA